jgi:acetylornithine deacetylase/succinyl-diaminopimelate desuccinylase-like protein
LEVHGIAGGFTAAGAKTVIPAKATAKVSFRLVPRQDPDAVVAAFRAWVAKSLPKGIQAEVRVLSACPGLVVNPDHPAIEVAARAFAEVFGKQTVFIRSGGSIPIVGDFANHLKIPTILMGFGLPDDGLHSPNEKYKIENYYLGIGTVAHFLELYGALD